MATRADENLISVGMPDSRARTYQYFVHGASPAMRALERTIADIASTDIPVLLVGESGTGKEVVALEIHRLSRHRSEPFVKCGCSGLTGDSLSARLQRAENVSAAEASEQRVLVSGWDQSPGSGRAGTTASSSSRRQRHAAARLPQHARHFVDHAKPGRGDEERAIPEELYYRINGVHLRLPPLRDRKEDIPALLEFFFKKYASLFERPEPKLSESTMSLLLRHSWPGNIRELENVARKIVALGDEQLATHDLTVENGTKAHDPLPDASKIPTTALRTSRPVH